MFLVPSTGVSYLNYTLNKSSNNDLEFSSPLRESLISIYDRDECGKQIWNILVPSTGVSYLNRNMILNQFVNYNSRPLYGGLLSQSCPLHLPKHKAFIPHLRGKPANERNLNIKLVYNILKA